MTEAAREHTRLVELLRALWDQPDHAEIDEDRLLAQLDVLWEQMTEEEREAERRAAKEQA